MANVVGIDIGVGSTKIVSLSKSDKGIVLETIGEVTSPNSTWINGEPKKMAEVTMAIKSLISDLKLKTKEMVVSLPEEEVVSRIIKLPSLKDSEIRDALKFEAETFIPYPLSEVSIDYEVIEKDEVGRLTVFAIAAKNQLINTYVKLFRGMGLELAAIESPAVAIKRVVNLVVGTEVSSMVVDMGEKYSDIVCIDKGNVYFTRAISVGGESLTRAISLNLGMDMASAEEYKKAYGLKEVELEGKVKAALLPVFSSMAEEIRRALTSFREDQSKSVNLLILSGGGANMPGLAEELTRILGVEIQVIQPFLRIETGSVSAPINFNSEGCRFTLATGLALRGMDV